MRYGKYELLFRQIGDPEWPFGSTHARLVLKDESGIITKYPFYVLNDGCSVHQDSWKVTWTDTYVKVVISGEEPVSYTHLDVYKRQGLHAAFSGVVPSGKILWRKAANGCWFLAG